MGRRLLEHLWTRLGRTSMDGWTPTPPQRFSGITSKKSSLLASEVKEKEKNTEDIKIAYYKIKKYVLLQCIRSECVARH